VVVLRRRLICLRLGFLTLGNCGYAGPECAGDLILF